jgi:hypothetical protein
MRKLLSDPTLAEEKKPTVADSYRTPTVFRAPKS